MEEAYGHSLRLLCCLHAQHTAGSVPLSTHGVCVCRTRAPWRRDGALKGDEGCGGSAEAGRAEAGVVAAAWAQREERRLGNGGGAVDATEVYRRCGLHPLSLLQPSGHLPRQPDDDDAAAAAPTPRPPSPPLSPAASAPLAVATIQRNSAAAAEGWQAAARQWGAVSGDGGVRSSSSSAWGQQAQWVTNTDEMDPPRSAKRMCASACGQPGGRHLEPQHQQQHKQRPVAAPGFQTGLQVLAADTDGGSGAGDGHPTPLAAHCC